MLWIDLIIYIVLIGAVVKGLISGAMARIVSVVAILLAFSEGWRIAPWIREDLLPWLSLDPGAWSGLLVPIVAFAVVYVTVSMLGQMAISVVTRGGLGLINRLAGAVLYFVFAIYAMGYTFEVADSVLPIGANQQALPPAQQDVRYRSEIYGPIRGSVVDLAVIRDYIRDVWRSR